MNIEFPLLLDGGLSNQLEIQGCDLDHALWTAKILQEAPEAVILAHLAYLEAGAQCITTASYQASLAGFTAGGLDANAAAALIERSVELAEEAVRRYRSAGRGDARPLIAASIGPYGAYLADGSEYRGQYGLSDEELRAFHLPRLRILDRSRADLLACETIPDLREARVLASMLQEAAKPAWLSFSCRDGGHINDGTPIEACAALLRDHPRIFALGVNCTAPQYVSPLIRALRENAGGKRIVVYPNSGEAYRADTKTWEGTRDPGAFRGMVRKWLEQGADIVGGCCRIGPRHIARVRDLF